MKDQPKEAAGALDRMTLSKLTLYYAAIGIRLKIPKELKK